LKSVDYNVAMSFILNNNNNNNNNNCDCKTNKYVYVTANFRNQ